MDVEEFWKLIDTTRETSGGDISKHADLLVKALAQLPVDKILDYETIMYDLMDNAYDAVLWDAAYVIGCGCGDSGFSDFRAWLIAQGQDVYDRALSDPEGLVDLIDVDKDAQEGALLYVAMAAYEQKTGSEMPLDPSKFRKYPVLKGKHWPEETVNERFPILAAKFGDCEQRWSLIH